MSAVRVLALTVVWLGWVALSPAQDPQVLVADEATSTAWTAVRFQLASRVSTLRAVTRTDDVPRLHETIGTLREDLTLFAGIAEIMTPREDWGTMRTALGRTNRLIANLERDMVDGSQQELVTTLRFLEESLLRLEELALLADIANRGGAGPHAMALPPDWGPLRHGDEAFRTGLVLLNARDLAVELERRRAWLRQESMNRLHVEAPTVAREMAELARALVGRQGEMPDLMRPGFRNAAMRLEVIAENLHDFHREGDRTRFRRQLTALDESLAAVTEYLAQRDRAP
ncbi:MAG: hypothetical protein KF858_09685 [Candidatus Sumerlaeia bacterium]|nr:hypothetical protein [Candidatus Sumerlaeia bacterium]